MPTEHTIEITDFEFVDSPHKLVVGDSVKWRNNDAMSHTATADDKSFDTGDISVDGGLSKPIIFNQAGEVSYHCKRHPQTMFGKLIVG